MKRNLSIDCLKIVSILFVVIWHITIYGVNFAELPDDSYAFWIISLLKSFSIVCVNCFILISGYFMSESDVNYKKLIGLWLQVEIYSVGIYLLLCLIPGIPIYFEVKTLIKQMLPLLSNQYWFFTDYLLLVLVSPILNIAIENMNETYFRRVIYMLLIIFSFIPSINIFGDPFGTNKGFSLIWFIVLYFVSAYIKRYTIPKWNYCRIYLVLTFLIFIVLIGCRHFSSIPFASVIINLVFMYNSIFAVGASIALFLSAICSSSKQIAVKYGTLIVKVSSFSFGVYLLHEHSQIREILWNQWAKLMEYVDSPVLFLGRLILIILGVFSSGIILNIFIRIIVDKCMLSGSSLINRLMIMTKK